MYEMTTGKHELKWGFRSCDFLREMLGWFEEIRICPIGLRRQTWARDSKDTTSGKKIQILSTQVPLEF